MQCDCLCASLTAYTQYVITVNLLMCSDAFDFVFHVCVMCSKCTYMFSLSAVNFGVCVLAFQTVVGSCSYFHYKESAQDATKGAHCMAMKTKAENNDFV